MPALVGGFGNYFLPIQVGAPDYLFNHSNKLLISLICSAYTVNKNPFYLDISNPSINEDNNNPNLQSLGPYLGGLFEGDGHVNIPKRYATGKLSYPYLSITFVDKDLPLVKILIELFGGRLRLKTSEHAIVWTIGKHKELIKFIGLLNGHLRTPKLGQFNALIQWLNDRYNYNIPINSVDKSELNENGWLAGYIDADGGFKLRYTDKKVDEQAKKVLVKGRTEVRFALEQRQYLPYNNQSYKPIMNKIQVFFGITTELKTSKHNIDKIYWIIEVTSLVKLKPLIQYLNNYPLLTAKRNDFDDWLKVYHLMIEKKHLTDEGKLFIKYIKSNFNRKRVRFNWDHLSYLNKLQ